MAPLVGVHPDDLARGVQVVRTPAEDREVERHAGAADPADPDADLDVLIEPDRRLVLDERPDGVEIDARRLGVHGLVVAQRPEVLGDRGVEIREIVRVEDHHLAVDLGIADPEGMVEAEVGSVHAASSAARSRVTGVMSEPSGDGRRLARRAAASARPEASAIPATMGTGVPF